MFVCRRTQRQTHGVLRQVDDFAIASPNKKHANSFLDVLDGHLKQKMKHQDNLSSFNGLDVKQTI